MAPATLRIAELDVPAERLEVEIRPGAAGEGYAVHIQLDVEAAAQLAQMTRYAVGKTLPVRVGDEVLMEPVVQAPVLDGNLLLAGHFTRSRAEAIAQALAPPCKVEAQTPSGPRR